MVWLATEIIAMFVVLELLITKKKIQNIKKILLIHNNYVEIKKDIQLCIDFDPTCDEFWLYHYRKSYQMGLGNFKWRYLKSYFDEYIYKLCWDDK